MCDEIINPTDNASTNVTNTIPTNMTILGQQMSRVLCQQILVVKK